MLIFLSSMVFSAQNKPNSNGNETKKQKREPWKRDRKLLDPRHNLGITNKNYYIDRAGNYVYYGKPIKEGILNVNYSLEGNNYKTVNYSIRHFYTPRITGDDLFDDVIGQIKAVNYKGQVNHTFRFLLKGNPYVTEKRGYTYLPRIFLRIEFQAPEGTKYIIAPLLNNEIMYKMSEAEIKKRCALILNSYKKFRSGINGIILYEKIRYSAFSWITLKRSRYKSIKMDKIKWHFYRKTILNEQHFTGDLEQIKKYLNRLKINFDQNKLVNYYKTQRYVKYPLRVRYYLLKFLYKDSMRYIFVPVRKMYHNTLNNPIKELVTFFARKFLKSNPNVKVLATMEKPAGKWNFISL
jgi:hypothetical protein